MTAWRLARLAAAGTLSAFGCGDSGAPPVSHLTRRSQNALITGDSVLSHAESLYMASEYDSVIAFLNPALADSRRRADATSEARILTRLGLTSYRQGELATSRSYLENALRIGTERGMKGELLEAHNALGLVAQDEDRYEDARKHFEEAIRLSQSTGDRRGFIKASGNLGLTLAYFGELRQARELLTMMRDSGRALGDRRYEANAMANIAMLDIWEGQAGAAIPTLESARTLYRAIGFVPGEQNALGQLATAYAEMGDYSKAFAALDSSLSLARGNGMKADEAEVLGLIAGLHARLGDYQAAIHAYDETAAAAARLDLTGELGIVKRSTAAIHLKLGDLERARADGQAALRAHRASGASFDQLDDLLTLAEIEQAAGRERETARLVARARAIADALGVRSASLAVALTRARLADRAHDPRRVLAALRGVDSTAVPGDFVALAEIHALEARAFAGRGMLDSAVAMGTSAIVAIERVRGDLASEPLRRALLADRGDVYAEQVIALLRLGREKEAFSVADAARSRGLIDYLASAKVDLHGPAGAARGDEGEQLLRQIDVLLAKLKSIDSVPARERGPGAASMSTELMARLERARADYELSLVRTRRENPRAAALLGVRETSLDQVQSVLASDEALLEYLVARDRIVLFVATRTALHTIQMNSASGNLVDRVRLLREIWGNRDSDWHTALPAARALHDVLLGGVIRAGALKGIHRLLVVPHGVLAQLPFAALVNQRTDRFVAQDFDIMYLPSAGTLPALRQPGGRSRSSLGGTAFAPFPSELPASADEVAAVSRALPRLRAKVGAAATEQAVRTALDQPGIVHVASHAMLNSRNPMFTRIDLFGVPGGNSSNDGRLEVHELLGASVRSQLVFLSGCETSVAQSWLDDAVRGTDYTTLAQALLYAGAQNVIGTLWRVDDSGSAAFAEHFYGLLAHQGLTEALGSAQRSMLGNPRLGHPYYWAGYILTGGGPFGL